MQKESKTLQEMVFFDGILTIMSEYTKAEETQIKNAFISGFSRGQECESKCVFSLRDDWFNKKFK